MARRSPSELAAHYAALAESQRQRAVIAADPTLKLAVNLRDMIASEGHTAMTAPLLVALRAFIDSEVKPQADAFIDGRLAK